MTDYNYGRCPYYFGYHANGVNWNFIRCGLCEGRIKAMPFVKQMRDFIASYCEGEHNACSGYDQSRQIIITPTTITAPEATHHGSFDYLMDKIVRMSKRHDLGGGPSSTWLCVMVEGQILFINDDRPCPSNWWRLTTNQVVKINQLAGGRFCLTS